MCWIFNVDYNSTMTNDSNDPGNCVTLCCGNCRGLQSGMLVGRNCNATDNSIVGRCSTCGMYFLFSVTCTVIFLIKLKNRFSLIGELYYTVFMSWGAY